MQSVDLEVILLDVEKAPRTAVGNLDKSGVREIFNSHSHFIARQLAQGRAVKVFNFGTFTTLTEKIDTGAEIKTASMPVFEVSDQVAKTCHLQRRVVPNTAGISEGALGATRTVQLNLSEISSEVGVPRDVVTTALRHVYLFLADRIRLGQNVQITYPSLGQLLSRPGNIDFKFYPKLIKEVAGDLPLASKMSHKMLTVKTGLIPGYEPRSARGSQRHDEPSSGYVASGMSHTTREAPRRLSAHQARALSATAGPSSGSYEQAGAGAGAGGGRLSVTGVRPATAESGAQQSGLSQQQQHSGAFSALSRASLLQHQRNCLCTMCIQRDQVLQAKKDKEARERELDRLAAEENVLALAQMERTEREKQAKIMAKYKEDAEFNKRLNQQQRDNHGKLRITEMGYLLESRKEPVPDATKRDKLRDALDGQIDHRKRLEHESRLRSLEMDRVQRETTLREMEEEKRKNAGAVTAKQAAIRSALEDQMRARTEAVPKAYDAIDHIFTASEGDEMVAKRKSRAAEIQAEQVRLIAGRREAATFERRAEVELAAKEALRVRSEMERERAAALSKSERLKLELRGSWDAQMQDRATRADLEKFGQERSLTSLNMPAHKHEDGEKCCRCAGPMPDGVKAARPIRTGKGIKA